MKKILHFALMLGCTLAWAQEIQLSFFADGFSAPCEITHAGDSRMFVVEQGGTIKILNVDGLVNETPFLDISSLTNGNGEQGLLGLAFHPDYANNGYLYVNYTNLSGDTVIARYTRSTENAAYADPASALILLTIDQPYSNHNGGCLRFGPDGFLYIGMGDGGSGGDPQGNGQNTNTLLGKLLRIDVNNGDTYSIPEGNPFVGIDGADEIWAYGLRNPWKFSFDRLSGDLWIADVGQNNIEEINMVGPAQAGINYGWRCFEGTETYNSNNCSLVVMYTSPVAEYNHDSGGCSITGGYVYTGNAYPALSGKYVFTDYCSGKIGLTTGSNEITWTEAFNGNFSTLGEDKDGELYIADIISGTVYKITDATATLPEFNTSNVKLFPNPAQNTVNLQTTNTTYPIRANIYDLSGKQILSRQYYSDTNTIDISALAGGLYIAEISNANGTVKQKLVVE